MQLSVASTYKSGKYEIQERIVYASNSCSVLVVNSNTKPQRRAVCLNAFLKASSIGNTSNIYEPKKIGIACRRDSGGLRCDAALDGMELGNFKYTPPEIRNLADILALHDKSYDSAKQFLSELCDDKALAVWKFTREGKELWAAHESLGYAL